MRKLWINHSPREVRTSSSQPCLVVWLSPSYRLPGSQKSLREDRVLQSLRSELGFASYRHAAKMVPCLSEPPFLHLKNDPEMGRGLSWYSAPQKHKDPSLNP